MSLEYLFALNTMQNDFNHESSHHSISGNYGAQLGYQYNDVIAIFSRYMHSKTNKITYDVEGSFGIYNFESQYDNFEETNAVMIGGKIRLFHNYNTKINIYGELGLSHSKFTSIYHEETNYPYSFVYPNVQIVKQRKIAKSVGVELSHGFEKNIEGFLTIAVFDNGTKYYTIMGKNTPASSSATPKKAQIGLDYLMGGGIRYYF